MIEQLPGWLFPAVVEFCPGAFLGACRWGHLRGLWGRYGAVVDVLWVFFWGGSWEHVVARGDSLGSFWVLFGTSWASLGTRDGLK